MPTTPDHSDDEEVGRRGKVKKSSSRGQSPKRSNTATETSSTDRSRTMFNTLQKAHAGGKPFGSSSRDGGSSTHTHMSSSRGGGETVLDVIPHEYTIMGDNNNNTNNVNPEPILHYLPKAIKSAQSQPRGKHDTPASMFPPLRVLLAAAEDDLRLHRARKQAGMSQDVSKLRTYKLEQDASWLQRQQRLQERLLQLQNLTTEESRIVQELSAEITGLTLQEKTQVQLARWQRALELYVYKVASPADGSSSSQSEETKVDLLGELEKLLGGISEVSKIHTYLYVCDSSSLLLCGNNHLLTHSISSLLFHLNKS